MGFFPLQEMKTHHENVALRDQQFAGVAGVGQSGTQEVKRNFLGLCCFCSKSPWWRLLDNKKRPFLANVHTQLIKRKDAGPAGGRCLFLDVPLCPGAVAVIGPVRVTCSLCGKGPGVPGVTAQPGHQRGGGEARRGRGAGSQRGTSSPGE